MSDLQRIPFLKILFILHINLLVIKAACKFKIYDYVDTDNYATENGWIRLNYSDLRDTSIYKRQLINYLNKNDQQIQALSSWISSDCCMAFATSQFITLNNKNDKYLMASTSCVTCTQNFVKDTSYLLCDYYTNIATMTDNIQFDKRTGCANAKNAAFYRKCTTKSPTPSPTPTPTSNPTPTFTFNPAKSPVNNPTLSPTNIPTKSPSYDGHTFEPNQYPTIYSSSTKNPTPLKSATETIKTTMYIIPKTINNETTRFSFLEMNSLSLILIGTVLALLCVIGICCIFLSAILITNNYYIQKVHKDDIVKPNMDSLHTSIDGMNAVHVIQQFSPTIVSNKNTMEGICEGLPLPNSMNTVDEPIALQNNNSTYTDIESMYGSVHVRNVTAQPIQTTILDDVNGIEIIDELNENDNDDEECEEEYEYEYYYE